MRPPYNGLEIAVGHQSRLLLSFKATGRSSGEVNRSCSINADASRFLEQHAHLSLDSWKLLHQRGSARWSRLRAS